MTELQITLHLAAEAVCPEGKAQLILAPRDFKTMRDFMRHHFTLLEATTNDVGERYFIKLPKYEEDEVIE